MKESYMQIDGEWFFLRHSVLDTSRPTLLFLHGLGESSLCFSEAFDSLRSLDFNLVAPDHIGYGRSSPARSGAGYSILEQIARLQNLAARLGLGRLWLVGHSFGGILATYWSSSDEQEMVEGLINIEGNLTPDDATFSKMAVEAYRDSGKDLGSWRKWFRDEFMEKLILCKYGTTLNACRRYYASLWFCRVEAFLANSCEIYEKSQPIEGSEASELGRFYLAVPHPKVYCWGTESLSDSAQQFLKQNGLTDRVFGGASHWPMIDRPDEFYPFLAKWVSSQSQHVEDGVARHR